MKKNFFIKLYRKLFFFIIISRKFLIKKKFLSAKNDYSTDFRCCFKRFLKVMQSSSNESSNLLRSSRENVLPPYNRNCFYMQRCASKIRFCSFSWFNYKDASTVDDLITIRQSCKNRRKRREGQKLLFYRKN